MKCDVCLTKIPRGSNVCPECGYVMKPEHENLFNVSSETHEHIQAKKARSAQIVQNRIKDIEEEEYKEDALDYPSTYEEGTEISLKKVILVIVILLSLAIFSFGMISTMIARMDETSSVLEDETTLRDIIDNGEDVNGVAANVLEAGKDLELFAKEIGMSDVTVSDYANKFDERLYVTYTVSGDINEHNVSLTLRENSYTSSMIGGFTLGFFNDQSMEELEIPIDEVTLNKIGDKLGIENMYSQLDYARKHLEKTADDEWRYSKDTVYVNSSYNVRASLGNYFHYYSIESNDE